jgi:hypothetical protein
MPSSLNITAGKVQETIYNQNAQNSVDDPQGGQGPAKDMLGDGASRNNNTFGNRS